MSDAHDPVFEPALTGHTVIDDHGDRVGEVEDVVFDNVDGHPKWAVVKMGVFRHRYVPLVSATKTGKGELVLPLDKQAIKNAPSVSHKSSPSAEDEHKLCDYYGISKV